MGGRGRSQGDPTGRCQLGHRFQGPGRIKIFRGGPSVEAELGLLRVTIGSFLIFQFYPEVLNRSIFLIIRRFGKVRATSTQQHRTENRRLNQTESLSHFLTHHLAADGLYLEPTIPTAKFRAARLTTEPEAKAQQRNDILQRRSPQQLGVQLNVRGPGS